MKKYIIFLLAMFVLMVLLPINHEKQIKGDIQENADVTFKILDNNYLQQGIEVLYPSIDGLSDMQIEQIINEQLKSEAFMELRAYHSGEVDLKNLSLSIQYENSYQSSNLLSIIYKGDAYLKEAAYPRSIFTTINIDLDTGKRLILADIIKIDSDFIRIVRNTLVNYINKNEDYRVIYEEKLQYSDDEFTHRFLNTDSVNGSDWYSFINEKNLGLCFSTSHVAGDYFLIEIELNCIKDNLTQKGKELILVSP